MLYEVITVDSAFEAYMKDPINSIYCIGSVVGPHPFPMMVRDFQRIIGIEAKDQFFEMTGELVITSYSIHYTKLYETWSGSTGHLCIFTTPR